MVIRLRPCTIMITTPSPSPPPPPARTCVVGWLCFWLRCFFFSSARWNIISVTYCSTSFQQRAKYAAFTVTSMARCFVFSPMILQRGCGKPEARARISRPSVASPPLKSSRPPPFTPRLGVCLALHAHVGWHACRCNHSRVSPPEACPTLHFLLQ
ncbi:unnamed protein product [Laminaria digitata]